MSFWIGIFLSVSYNHLVLVKDANLFLFLKNWHPVLSLFSSIILYILVYKTKVINNTFRLLKVLYFKLTVTTFRFCVPEHGAENLLIVPKFLSGSWSPKLFDIIFIFHYTIWILFRAFWRLWHRPLFSIVYRIQHWHRLVSIRTATGIEPEFFSVLVQKHNHFTTEKKPPTRTLSWYHWNKSFFMQYMSLPVLLQNFEKGDSTIVPFRSDWYHLWAYYNAHT